MTLKPKAVVFDLGKVLLDFDYGKVATRMVEHCDVPHEEIVVALNQSPLLHQYETGLMTTGQFFAEVQRLSRFCGEFSQFAEIFSDIFHPVREMVDLHTRLRQESIPTYCFSNTNELATEHIRKTYPFFGQFTGHILSYQHRSMKPDPAIYEVVERKALCRGPELLYIDDRLENVEQGAARGWQTIHHSEPRETIARVEALLLR